MKHPNFELHQYNVKFEPAIEDKPTRVRLIASKRELLGFNIYNGDRILYTFNSINRLNPEYQVETKEQTRHILRIAHEGRIEMSSSEALQVMNIILRRTMKGLDLQLVGRHLFDPKKAVSVLCDVWIECTRESKGIEKGNWNWNCFRITKSNVQL